MKKVDPNPDQARVAQTFNHDRPLNVCAFDQTGEFIYAAGEERPMHRWNIASGEKTTLDGHASWVRGFAFLPFSKEFITSAFDGRLAWWSGEATDTEPPLLLAAHVGWVRSIA